MQPMKVGEQRVFFFFFLFVFYFPTSRPSGIDGSGWAAPGTRVTSFCF